MTDKKKRSEDQIKQSLSEGALRKALGTSFVINELDEDFGLDFQATVTKELDEEYQEVGPINFFIQLKSSQSFGNDDLAKFDADTVDLKLYLQQSLPVVLVLYDVDKDEFYWTIIQEYIWDTLKEDTPDWRNQKGNRIKIDKDQSFDKLDQLRTAILEAQNRILRRQNMALEIGEGLRLDDIGELEAQQESSLEDYKGTSLLKSYRLQKRGDQDSAREELEKVYQAPEEDEGKLRAVIGLSHTYNPLVEEEALEVIRYCEEGIELAKDLDLMGDEKYLQVNKSQAELFILLDLIQQRMITKNFQEKADLPLFEAFYNQDLLDLLNKQLQVSSELNEALSSLLEDGHFTHYAISLPLVLDYIGEQISRFVRLDVIDQDKLQSSDFVHPIAEQSETVLEIVDDEETQLILNLALGGYYYHTYETDKANERLSAALDIARDIDDKGRIELLEDFLSRVQDSPDPYEVENSDDEKTLGEFQESLRDIVEMQGIDIDQNDRITDSLKLGIKDADPTEYFKHCEHLRIKYLTTSPLGESLGVYTLGNKVMWCKHGGGTEGLSLETLFHGFKNRHCEGCPHHSPRPHDWTGTVEWVTEQEQDSEFLEYLRARYQP
ncbi:DUF4365 domain-containing protein [Haloarcula sp. Atlit-7R]|uniref:DUF4365 domain-containing protein n=1 Tax=Haloarcula sp. Atlit-7R TaxID=2282125 RepID=UPI001314755A|nr:DUF4365 domain-containing protein [Haloarcula sp. Atlit-7R]